MKEFSNPPKVTLFEMKIVERTFKMLDDTGMYTTDVVSITISKYRKKF